jgi:hypothetical protein
MTYIDPEVSAFVEVHAAASAALLNAVPTMTEDQAQEILINLTKLILHILDFYNPGDDDAADYN